MFGYGLKVIDGGRTMKMASAEKAILDLLYLYPGYSSAKEIEALRFDEDYLHDDLKKDLLIEYSIQFKNKALEKRVQQLFITYGL